MCSDTSLSNWLETNAELQGRQQRKAHSKGPGDSIRSRVATWIGVHRSSQTIIFLPSNCTNNGAETENVVSVGTSFYKQSKKKMALLHHARNWSAFILAMTTVVVASHMFVDSDKLVLEKCERNERRKRIIGSYIPSSYLTARVSIPGMRKHPLSNLISVDFSVTVSNTLRRPYLVVVAVFITPNSSFRFHFSFKETILCLYILSFTPGCSPYFPGRVDAIFFYFVVAWLPTL